MDSEHRELENIRNKMVIESALPLRNFVYVVHDR